MVCERIRRLSASGSDAAVRGARGFSLAELIVVMAVIGILAAVGMPAFLSYWQTSTLRASTQELTALLNGARHLAIQQNQTVCVKADNSSTGSYSSTSYGRRVQYFIATTCTGTAWKGIGTDSDGYMSLSNDMRVQSSTTGVAFTYLGAASGVGGGALVFYLCNPNDTGRHARVTVAVSGRISTTYHNTPC